MKKITYIIALLLLAACEAGDTSKASSQPVSGGETGAGGSTARFSIVGDRLYTVSESDLKWFDISTPEDPIVEGENYVGRWIETIFPKGEYLFIGSQSGVYVYQIGENGTPSYVADIQHFVNCDPVVADDQFAYVTISSGSDCRGNGNLNEMQIIRLNNLHDMKLEATMQMTNPKGLGVRNNRLYVCDDGLKIYDTTNAPNLVLLDHFDINVHDVIPLSNSLLAIGSDGFRQYKYENNSVSLLSRIPIEN